MTAKTVKNICRGVAIVQAILAPGLMIIGHITGNKTMKNVGIAWCGLIVLDTGRTTWIAIDAIYEVEGLKDDMIL